MEEQISRIAAQVADRLFVEVEASGRHVHLTKDQAMTLFGHGLTPKRPLSQPGQFVCQERVEVLGPKGSFPKVAVLGPERKEGQVEISLTDGVTLGLTAPVRLSGQVRESPGITLRGPKGEVHLDHGVIVAQRHIHMPPRGGRCPGASQTARWCGSKCSPPGRWYSTTWWCGWTPAFYPPGFTSILTRPMPALTRAETLE